ncbi:hypothetical protein AAZX31_13G215700 [Glycine max]|nr:hypothetical protein GLYMA_13G233050v4 [Glycine max]KAG4971418.1 hypothetical protein JHK85_037839 [Glycine max]KAH1102972.1 hypothetical protein GYH30_037132 [Glycine max]KAH1217923.1 hypothetical protein GmHk_13G038462 [Glycine max]KHN08468.1 hypothetical protein glysoja_014233 [Glycine soja]
MGSKTLLIGLILVHALLLSYFSFITNASDSDHRSLLNFPHPHMLQVKTIKRRIPTPPPPKPNGPIQIKPPYPRSRAPPPPPN